MNNPYYTFFSHTGHGKGSVKARRHYGGIRRLPYLGIMIGFVFMDVSATGLSSHPSNAHSALDAAIFVALCVTAFSFFPVYYRLKNIGINPWWCLLVLVPPANLLLGGCCLVFQEGYTDTKKIDKAGKLSALVLGIVLLAFATVVVRTFRHHNGAALPVACARV